MKGKTNGFIGKWLKVLEKFVSVFQVKITSRTKKWLLAQGQFDIIYLILLGIQCFSRFFRTPLTFLKTDKFFAPDIARDIDWSKAPIFMDKELSQVMKGAKTGKRFVDKLVQVFKLGIWIDRCTLNGDPFLESTPRTALTPTKARGVCTV